MSFAFTCPYCDRPTTIGHSDSSYVFEVCRVPEAKDLGKVGVGVQAIVCPNQECKRATLGVVLRRVCLLAGEWHDDEKQPNMMVWNLLPKSKARQYGGCVPQAIKEDYEEAHLILNDSPKASATLSRRALQGIMRNFYGAKPGNLKDEIDAVEMAGKMEPTLVEALHAVRSVGNIGAHMEKDISLIVPVDPGEAEALLRLIELLLDETYVARAEREKKVKRVVDIAGEKKALKTAPAPKALPTGTTGGT